MGMGHWGSDAGRWWRDTKERFKRRYTVRVVESDVAPQTLGDREIVILQEGGEDWSAALRCPCGCGDIIELALILEARPRWNFSRSRKAHPNLSPSVWRRTGCRSHFWLRQGRIAWF